jgi:WD40 repeat protein
MFPRRLLCLFLLTATGLNAQDVKPLLRLDAGGHTAAVRAALFRPNSSELVSVSFDKSVRLWDVTIGAALHSLLPPAGVGKLGALYSAAIAPDGQTLAVCGLFPEHQIYLVDLEGRRITRTLKGHTSTVQCVAWAGNTRLVSGSHDLTGRVWNVETGAVEATLEGHQAPIYGIACSPDGSRCVTAALDRRAGVWNVKDGQRVAALLGHEREVLAAAWSPDGAAIATGSLDGSVKLWTPAGVLQKTLDRPGGPLDRAEILSVAFLPDSQRLVYTQGNGLGRHCGVLDVAKGTVSARFSQHSDSVLCVSVSADGRQIATGDGAGVIYVWDPATG